MAAFALSDPSEAPACIVREDERRALRARLRRTVEELEWCHRKAVDIGDAVNAARIRAGIEVWREVVEGVEREER